VTPASAKIDAIDVCPQQGQICHMHEQQKAILNGLVSVAWADGTFDKRESEMLDALLDAFGASEEETSTLKEYAKEKRGLDDIQLTELSFGDRRALMSHAVCLSWIDGDQSDDEVKFLEQLRDYLKIGAEEFDEISKVHTARAKELLEKFGND
jgi:tellurite resistance protein